VRQTRDNVEEGCGEREINSRMEIVAGYRARGCIETSYADRYEEER